MKFLFEYSCVNTGPPDFELCNINVRCAFTDTTAFVATTAVDSLVVFMVVVQQR